MTKVSLLLAGAGIASGLILAWLESRRRQQERDADPDYVRSVRTWYELAPEGDEPSITPLDLPAVKPLKALKAPKEPETMPMDNLRVFGQRPGRRD